MSRRKQRWAARAFFASLFPGIVFGLFQINSGRHPIWIWPVTSHTAILPVAMAVVWTAVGIGLIVGGLFFFGWLFDTALPAMWKAAWHE